ncbi:pyroglutamyl-peptidase 1 [Drosophila sulfurigaster albostrigata]|uniref:pyroglutamyl-peptidase 1 n=1 Tax=Drosophila sulfurigaster albostrigata TaxID=89887 RepID=UPI002D21C987|nr:pyroglutamyl-peptidase 1 [Drosophila sulfurigaster albostrigata]
MAQSERKLILVTGFGPFVGHEEVNASWEAVQLLPDVLTYEGIEYQLEKRKVDVEYAAVDEAVTDLWQKKPELVVHVGVSGVAKCVYVEKLAYNHQFRRPDNAGQYLEKATCCLPYNAHANVLRTGLNVDKIVQAVNETCKDCVAPVNGDNDKSALTATQVSKNVGGFLCGYIYLKSLDVDCKRSLFVHVPPIDTPFSTPQTAVIVYKIIEQCVQQLTDC